jgi:hypothetical protein
MTPAAIKKVRLDTAYPYWDAETVIAKRFYATATREGHIHYLRAQLSKSDIKKFLTAKSRRRAI